jgi:beta-galactosidase
MAPLCPTKEEIAQWMWTIIGTQGKGGIFWSLNPRSSGIEAGEWAMLDFQDKPSDRLTAAAEVIKVIDSKPGLFANAREVESGINLLYFRESLWAEKKMASPSSPRYEGREEGAVMKSLLAYFETFSELGINSNIKEFGEFNFSGDNFTGQVIVLANQIAIPSGCVADLEKFVSKGGKLIVDGLSGFFDENLHNTMKTGFSMERLLGGNISEFKVVDNLFDLKIGENDLPAHLWRGYIDKKSGQVISSDNGIPVALRNFHENGVTLWIPSLIGLGAWIDDNSELAKFLKTELKTNFERSPFSFTCQQKGTLMKTLQSGNSYITILINKTAETKNIELQVANQKLKPEIIYADKSEFVSANSVHISPEETVVILWKQN